MVPTLYAVALAFLGLSIFGCYNYYKFLWKAQPRRKLSDPLSMFYLASISATFIRIFSSVYLVQIYLTSEILIKFLPGLLKLNIGLIKSWIMIELILRVN